MELRAAIAISTRAPGQPRILERSPEKSQSQGSPRASWAALFRKLVQADILRQPLAPAERKTAAGCPGFRVRTGVVDHDLVFHRSWPGPCVFFDQVQLLGVRMAGIVQPRSVIEAHRVHNQRLA